MPVMRKKSELPTKICPVCQRPFTWRKKWRNTWETIRFCSDRCRKFARSGKAPGSAA